MSSRRADRRPGRRGYTGVAHLHFGHDGRLEGRGAHAGEFRDQRAHSGDGLGSLTLQGRRSDLIISGGFNIYPREIEELILEQPGPREATVVGAPDPVRGEVPVAYVVVDAAQFDEAAIVAHLRTQLASFKLPKSFVRVESLPRTALGKVQKHLLPVVFFALACLIASVGRGRLRPRH